MIADPDRKAPRDGGEAQAGVRLEVLDGPMDGLVLTGEFDAIHIGRRTVNIPTPGDRGRIGHLLLPLDTVVSGEHARLTQLRGRWTLEDLGSTNGTFTDGGRVSGAIPLPPDGIFVAGSSVLRLVEPAGGSSNLPTIQELLGRTAQILDSLSPAAMGAWGSATRLALDEGRGFVTERDLFLGLATFGVEPAIFARDKGMVPAAIVTGPLRKDRYWSGPRSWIAKIITEAAAESDALYVSELHPTPRLFSILLEAERSSRAAESTSIDPLDLLAALFRVLPNRPAELLEREGIATDRLLQVVDLSRKSRGPRRDAGRGRTRAALTSSFVVPSRVAPVSAKAQDLAREIQATSSLYQLADPDERAEVLRRRIKESLSPLAREHRRELLADLRVCFPVEAGTADGISEIVQLRKEIESLRSRVAELSAKPGRPAETPIAAAGWRLVLEPKPDREASLDPADRAGLAHFREINSFAVEIERFIIGIVNGLASQSQGTESFQLPGINVSIQKFSKATLAGQTVPGADLHDYLGAVETWLLAVIAAYHESPGIWFDRFWRQVNPTALESSTGESGWKARLGMEPVKLWNQYKESVRHITPELVSDEILRIAQKRAEEQYQKMWEKRKGK